VVLLDAGEVPKKKKLATGILIYVPNLAATTYITVLDII
jgi:hypothetical protein